MGSRKIFSALISSAIIGLMAVGGAHAVTIIPQSSLIPSTTYYTDTIGGGIGDVVVTTGGGNAANVGDPDRP